MKRAFIPRARLMSILGEQLIKDDVVGLLELVKNGYDADATEVVVVVLDANDPSHTQVTIKDNGSGMSLNTVEDHWLQPASGHKENIKKNKFRSKRGRLPQGEKGVGRFAAQRLGRYLTLVTKESDAEEEIVISIDWDQFNDAEKSLSEVLFDVTLRRPETFPGTSGTLLSVTGVREQWTQRSLKRVNRYLERMMSPFKGAKDFSVQLVCPEYPELQALNPSRITDYAHFKLIGDVDDSGKMVFDYESVIPGCESRKLHGMEVGLAKSISSRELQCGPFSVYVFGWHRSPDVLGRTPDVSRTELDERSGIHVFRDGIRVLPYGEPGDDWLELDQRRINRPAERLGNKNLIGFIELQQDLNPTLRDKTNREGLVENQAFHDFRMLAQQCIQELENLFFTDRQTLKEEAQAHREAEEASLSRKGEALKEKLQRTNLATPGAAGADTDGNAVPESDLSQQVVSFVEGSQKMLREQKEAARAEYQALLGLAGLGLTAERFTHEFERLVKKAEDRFARIERRLGKGDINVLAVRSAIDALAHEIRRLEPLLSYQRRDKGHSISVGAAVDTAILLNSDYAHDSRVNLAHLSSGDFTVKMPSGTLVQVLNNLLDNAIYWARSNKTNLSGNIVISTLARDGLIVVEDDGPGIDPHLGDSIFSPFVSQRREGHGLGLFICRQLLQEEGCDIRVLAVDSELRRLGGAGFVVDLGNSQANAEADEVG